MREKIEEYVTKWQNRCYPELPDEAPKEIDEFVPSYKKIVIAILRNDLKLLGATLPVSEWYGYYKRIELNDRARKI